MGVGGIRVVVLRRKVMFVGTGLESAGGVVFFWWLVVFWGLESWASEASMGLNVAGRLRECLGWGKMYSSFRSQRSTTRGLLAA